MYGYKMRKYKDEVKSTAYILYLILHTYYTYIISVLVL